MRSAPQVSSRSRRLKNIHKAHGPYIRQSRKYILKDRKMPYYEQQVPIFATWESKNYYLPLLTVVFAEEPKKVFQYDTFSREML